MKARRRGIIIKIPKSPPSTATVITLVRSISKPSSINAGIVAPTPNAIDSPAEPVVCTMLFSRIVARRKRRNDGKTEVKAESPRNSDTERTAIGIDADTVIPTLSTKYIDEAAKIIPNTVPVSTAGQVNSAMLVSDAGTYGLNAGVASSSVGFSGTPMINSLVVGSRRRQCIPNGLRRTDLECGDLSPLWVSKRFNKWKYFQWSRPDRNTKR